MTAPQRILLVDDQPQHRKIARWHFTQEGFEVAEAANLAEARELLGGLDEIDALVVDGTLPDGDGLELVAAIRADRRRERTPVFVVSGHAAEADRLRGLSAGATDYFTKPVDYAALTAELRAAIGGKRP